MRIFPLLLIATLVYGCETTTQHTLRKSRKARVTYYCKAEDRRWGNRTASGVRAKSGVTVAAEPAIPFGTPIQIPELTSVFGDAGFVVQDRGAAVTSRRASKGLLPVIDVYTKSRTMMKKLAASIPPILEIEE